MQHTTEPWRVEADANSEEIFWISSANETEIAMIADGRICDATRIAACVNACAGIPTETLEKYYGDQGGIDAALEEASLREHVCAAEQRAKLLAAVKTFLSGYDCEEPHQGLICEGIELMREALAKVGAGGTATEGHNDQAQGGEPLAGEASPGAAG